MVLLCVRQVDRSNEARVQLGVQTAAHFLAIGIIDPVILLCGILIDVEEHPISVCVARKFPRSLVVHRPAGNKSVYAIARHAVVYAEVGKWS